MVSRRDHFDVTSTSPRCHFDLNRVPPHFTSTSLRFLVGFTSISLRRHINFTSISLQFHLWLTSIALRYHFYFTLTSLRFHIEFTSSLLRTRTNQCGRFGKLVCTWGNPEGPNRAWDPREEVKRKLKSPSHCCSRHIDHALLGPRCNGMVLAWQYEKTYAQRHMELGKKDEDEYV